MLESLVFSHVKILFLVSLHFGVALLKIINYVVCLLLWHNTIFSVACKAQKLELKVPTTYAYLQTGAC